MVPSREEKIAETEEKILSVTVSMLLDPELVELNTNEIAKLAGVAKGTIFARFETKNNLIMKAFQKILEIQKAEFIKADLGNINNPTDMLKLVIGKNLELISEHQNLTMILINVLSDFSDPDHLNDLDEFARTLMELMVEPLSHTFIELGWKEEDLPYVIQILASILDGLAIQAQLSTHLPSGQLFSFEPELMADLIVRLFDKRQ